MTWVFSRGGPRARGRSAGVLGLPVRVVFSPALAATATLALLTSTASAMTLARNGVARASIVVASDAFPSERTAAKELATYLGLSTSAEFPIEVETTPLSAGRAAIYVGATAFARNLGLDPARLGDEEWVIRSGRDWLVLCGGRPRGTLYAAYRFLETRVGVRWWNPYEETVPARRTFSIGRLDERGRPAFRYRDLSGIDGPQEFRARSRLNGQLAPPSPDFGGHVAFGTPWFVHSFYSLVPPDEFFATHPEYFSERAGFRAAGRSQLCLTNRQLQDIVAREIGDLVRESGETARLRGVPAPILFDVSQNDWGGPCQCAACKAVSDRNGSQAGPLLEMVNRVADAIRIEHPDVFVTTLAYTFTFPPPKEVRPRDNVIVRLSGFGERDFSKSVVDKANSKYRDAVLGWASITKHLWIWDYAVTFGVDNGLPLASYRDYAPDLRFYLRQGVEGMFIQHEYPIAGDLRDLKVWMTVKLLENPWRDPNRLIDEFSEGFYGRAGRHVRRYLRALERAEARRPCTIGVNAEPADYRFIDLDFVLEANRIFDRAERDVRDDPVLSRRVRHARLSLDYATLARFGELARQARASSRRGARSPLDRDRIAARYRRTWLEQIDLRIPEWERARARADLEEELGDLLDAARAEGGGEGS